MFRGFRWQLIALIMALAVFSAGLVYRNSRLTALPPTPAMTPTRVVSSTTTPSATDSAVTTTVVASDTDENIVVSATAFREGIVGTVQRLNPAFAHLNPIDNDISSLIFEGLFAINDYGEVVPRLADELVISTDGLEYVVRLRDDVSWQDGVPFGADDVVYTMSLLSEAEDTDLLPAGEFWRTVEMQKLTDRLVRFRLAQPFSSFPYLLTIGMLPEHALSGTNASNLASHPFNLSPVGTGAYQLGALVGTHEAGISALQLLLSPVFRQRNEAENQYLFSELWFHLYPNADAAMSAYASSEVNALAGFPLTADKNLLSHSALYTQVNATLGILIFNWEVELFSERRMRQALSLSLNVPELVQTHFGSAATYADSPFVPGSSAYRPHPFWRMYDLAQAQLLVDGSDTAAGDEINAGTDDDERAASTSRQTIGLLVEDTAQLRGMANDIASQWRRIGLDVSVELVNASALMNRLDTGRFDTAIVRQRIGADPDLFRFWHPAQHAIGLNYGAASDNAIAELLEAARTEIYSIRRANLYQQIQEAFAEQAIAVPLYYPLFTYIARDSIEGIQLGFLTSSADRYRNISDWRPATETG